MNPTPTKPTSKELLSKLIKGLCWNVITVSDLHDALDHNGRRHFKSAGCDLVEISRQLTRVLMCLEEASIEVCHD